MNYMCDLIRFYQTIVHIYSNYIEHKEACAKKNHIIQSGDKFIIFLKKICRI